MPGFDEAALPQAAALFFEAAVEPDLWDSALPQIAQICGSEGSLVMGHGVARASCISSDGLLGFVDSFFRDGWYLRNPWPERMMIKRLEWAAVTEWMLYDARELRHLPIFNDLTLKQKLPHSLGVVLTTEGGMTSFNLGRRAGQGPFEPREIEALLRVLPEFRRAATLAIRLADAREAGIGDLLEGIAPAAVLLDSAGKVTRMNLEAERLLGTSISISDGQLRTKDPNADKELRMQVAAAIHDHARFQAAKGIVVIHRIGERPVIAEIVPLPGAIRYVFSGAKVAVFLTDLGASSPVEVELCRKAFGLTKAEAVLACAIAEGIDLQAYAETAGLSIETVRTRLKSVFAKTDTHRQAELAALLAKLKRVASVRGREPG